MGNVLYAKQKEEFWGGLPGALLLLIPADGKRVVCKTKERILATCQERSFYQSRPMGTAVYAKPKKEFGNACLER